jgi:hypothetical protein
MYSTATGLVHKSEQAKFVVKPGHRKRLHCLGLGRQHPAVSDVVMVDDVEGFSECS